MRRCERDAENCAFKRRSSAFQTPEVNALIAEAVPLNVVINIMPCVDTIEMLKSAHVSAEDQHFKRQKPMLQAQSQHFFAKVFNLNAAINITPCVDAAATLNIVHLNAIAQRF